MTDRTKILRKDRRSPPFPTAGWVDYGLFGAVAGGLLPLAAALSIAPNSQGARFPEAPAPAPAPALQRFLFCRHCVSPTRLLQAAVKDQSRQEGTIELF